MGGGRDGAKVEGGGAEGGTIEGAEIRFSAGAVGGPRVSDLKFSEGPLDPLADVDGSPNSASISEVFF